MLRAGVLGRLEDQSFKDIEMFRAEAPGGRGEEGNRETSSLRQGEDSMAGWVDMLQVPGQAPSASKSELRPLGRAAGLSFSGCQSGLGSRNWFSGSSPGSQPLLAALFGESAQGLVGLPPHHLPAASSWLFHP